LIHFLKNFFLPYPARPINPDPRRSMVAGSGTAAGTAEPQLGSLDEKTLPVPPLGKEGTR